MVMTEGEFAGGIECGLSPSPEFPAATTPTLAHLHEHERRLVCDAAVEAVGEAPVARGGDGGLSPVPVPGLRRRAERGFLARDVEECLDPAGALGQVRVRVESRVEEGDGDAPARVV